MSDDATGGAPAGMQWIRTPAGKWIGRDVPGQTWMAVPALPERAFRPPQPGEVFQARGTNHVTTAYLRPQLAAASEVSEPVRKAMESAWGALEELARLGSNQNTESDDKRKQVRARIYWRTRRDGAARAWGDFREYAEQGGKREPLVQPGESRATTDAVIAQTLFARAGRARGSPGKRHEGGDDPKEAEHCGSGEGTHYRV